MSDLASIHKNNFEFVYASSEEQTGSYHIHYHDVYELYYFLEGDVDYLVEGKQYHPTPHSILLLSPHAFHGVKVNSSKPYRRITLHFSPQLLRIEQRALLLSCFPGYNSHIMKEGLFPKEVYYENTENYHIYSHLDHFIDCSTLPSDLSNLLTPIYLEALLASLTIMYQSTFPYQTVETISSTATQIIDYLNSHLTEHISLDDIAGHFYISKYYLNRVFRKATGTTIGNYLTYKRVTYAKQLLQNGYSASEAAAESGFNDYSAFYRAYKKITHRSPADDCLTFQNHTLPARQLNKK